MAYNLDDSQREQRARDSRRHLEESGYTSNDGTFYTNSRTLKEAWIDANGETHREM